MVNGWAIEQTTPTIRLTFRVVVTHYTKVTSGFEVESFSKPEISPCGF